MEKSNEVGSPETNVSEITEIHADIPQQPLNTTPEQPPDSISNQTPSELLPKRKINRIWLFIGIISSSVVLCVSGFFIYRQYIYHSDTNSTDSTPTETTPIETIEQSPIPTHQSTNNINEDQSEAPTPTIINSDLINSFSIEYPENYIRLDNTSFTGCSSISLISTLDIEELESSGMGCYGGPYPVYKNTIHISIKDFPNSEYPEDKESNDYFIYSKTLVNNYDAIKMVHPKSESGWEDSAPNIAYYIPHNDKLYRISYGHLISDQQFLQEVESIISTIKFID